MREPRLPRNEGLLLPRCASVHTFFMRFAIDIVYLDRHGTVTKIVRDVKPWRLSAGGRNAMHTLELAAGDADRIGICVGRCIGVCIGAEASLKSRGIRHKPEVVLLEQTGA
ncbi:MAG: DUF192 domain-containing protein [Pseudomonadota bacterium]|nr:DUF192 domain-containing protein [Pseudomonadota bacterium]